MDEMQVTNGSFKTAWKDWQPKLNTFVQRNARPEYYDGSTDDLLSLAQMVLLKALRTHQSNRTKFSTYLYTCLHNKLHTQYLKHGVDKVQKEDKEKNDEVETDEVETSEDLLTETSPLNAWRKRIPTRQLRSLENLMDSKVNAETLLPIEHPLEVSLTRLFKVAAKHVQERKSRRILWDIYCGRSLTETARHLNVPFYYVKKRVNKLRKPVQKIMENLDLANYFVDLAISNK